MFVSISPPNFQHLLISCESSEAFSTQFLDPRTGVAIWSHKGAELQGGIVGSVALVGDSHLAIAIRDKPLLHVIGLRARPRFHVKSVLPAAVSHLLVSPDRTLLFAASGTRIFSWLVASHPSCAITRRLCS